MKTISPIEQEVDRIRLAIYEKTKGMTPEQLGEYYIRSTEPTIQKYGLRVIESPADLHRSHPTSQSPSTGSAPRT